MNLLRYTIVIACCFLTFQQLNGQTLKAYLKAAEEAVEVEDHYSALVYYQNAIEFDSTNLSYLYGAAESARKFNSYTLAEKYYQRVYDEQTEREYPLTGFYLASMKQRLGKYDEAIEAYGVYLSEFEGDSLVFTERAVREMEASEWAKEVIENPWEELDIRHKGEQINTPYTEFGAIRQGDSLFFSSMAFIDEEDDHYPQRSITHIMVSEEGVVSPLPDSINLASKHTAHTAFSRNADRVYFTLCEYVSVTGIECDIYYRNITEGKWESAVRLPDTINIDGFTSTQPNVGIDPVTGNEVLYYVSDRPGGQGEMDIWAAEILEDGEFGLPYNLETINTIDDDISPFFHHNTNILYFSSRGYRGMGGFDIYKSHPIQEGWGEVTHLGYPLNSSYDDTYYALSDDEQTALFSSNRDGSLFVDDNMEACCFDIYEVHVLPVADLIVQSFDSQTGDSLAGVGIQLIDLADPENLIWEQYHEDSVAYTFPLYRDRSYMVTAEREGYLPDTLYFNTEDIEMGEDIVKQFYLKPDVVELEILVFDAGTKVPLVGATVSSVDLTSGDLDRVEITNQDGNDFQFEVKRDHTYRVLANRKGYESGTLRIEPSDMKGVDKLVREIYLVRGGLSDYLPLVLYFDNDLPNRRSWSETTDVRYSQTFTDYYAKKDEFIEIFTEPLEGEEETMASAGLTRFFETEARKGYEDLDRFFERLEVHLEAQDEVRIHLKGYASPRARPEYNMRLGMRRVNSVKNDLMSYRDGYFKQYLDSGQLAIELESFGSTTAPSEVVGDLDDERNSIYSLGASKERRVEIIHVRIN
nr:PD40 domain-containing protein [Saprospiraceae bacterium]